MRAETLGRLLPFAAGAAIAAALAAVGLGAVNLSTGYELGRAQAAHAGLWRERSVLAQQLAELRAPAAVLRRAAAQGIALSHRRGRRPAVIHVDDVRFLRRAVSEATGSVARAGER